MVATLLALLAVSIAEPTAREILPNEVSESLARALVVPGARIVPIAWSGKSDCRIRSASVPRVIAGSGRVAVKFTGARCSGWGWAEVEVWAETAVTTRLVRAGEPIEDAVAMVEREIRPGQSPFAPGAGALALRVLPAGTLLSASDVGRTAVVAGDPIKVLVAAGLIAIETRGRRISCPGGHACAVLPSGKHVQGRVDEMGRLIVEAAP